MKKAFTLSEVLITLGIIGVVAALTIPIITTKLQKHILQVQLKKSYSELSELSKRFYVNEGISISDYSAGKNASAAEKYIFEKYIPGSKLVDGTWDMRGIAGTFNKYVYILKNISRKNSTTSVCDYGCTYRSPNGTMYTFDDTNKTITNFGIGPIVCVDINGSKGPNAYGWDFFIFIFQKDGSVIPDTVYAPAGEGYTVYESPQQLCNMNKSALSCAYYALKDESPEDSSKSYWRDFLPSR